MLEFLNKLGPQRLAAMGAVTLALVGFFAFVIMRMSQPVMTPLFTDLSFQDSNAIIKELDARGVKYEIRQDGATILAPKEQALRIRMDLAGKGMPSGGGIGYEIFDKGDAFSTTSFVQNVNHVRALEGELSRTIRALDRVVAARVHLVLPERQLFARDKEEARASIVVKTRGELDSGQIRAIRHLVATAVPSLKPERVSIVDESGKLLADGAADSNGIAQSDDKRVGYEKRVRSQVEDIVASIVGNGRARVQVAAEMDFNRVQQTSESYDPESKVVRSTQNRSETSVTNDTTTNGEVTVNNQLPVNNNNQSGTPPSKDTSNKTEETINYEISRTTKTETIEGGRVKHLSVAVLVDGTYTRGANNEATYQPRPQEELDRIATLVRSAIGYDKARGDQVEVVNLKFAEVPQPAELKELTFTEKLLNFSKDDIMRIAEMAILSIISIFVLLMVVRPLMRQILAPITGGGGGGPGGIFVQHRPLGALVDAANAAIDPVTGRVSPNAILPRGPSDTEKMIEISQVNGSIQAKSVEKVGELVTKSPQESIAILRQYIHARPT